MKISNIERCLVNPLLIYEVFFGLDLPFEENKCINAQYGPFMNIYDALCEENPNMDKFISDYMEEHFVGIREQLFPVEYLKDPFRGLLRLSDWFLQFIERYEEPIMHLQTLFYLTMADDEDVRWCMDDMPRFFKDLAYIPKDMAFEVYDAMIIWSDDPVLPKWMLERFMHFVRKSELHMIDVLYYPDRYRKLVDTYNKGGYFMDTDTESGRTNLIRIPEEFKMPELKQKPTEPKEVTKVKNLPVITDDELPIPDKEKEFIDPDEIKNIRKNVNKFDETYDVDLKHPRNMIDEEVDFNEQLTYYRYLITKMVSSLNGQGDKYAVNDGIFGLGAKRIKLNKKFREASKWFDGQAHQIHHKAFKSRFVTHMGMWLADNLEDIVKKCFKLRTKSTYTEWEEKAQYMEQITMAYLDFVNNLLSGRQYTNELMYLNMVQIYMKTGKKKNALKRSYAKINNIDEQTTLLSDRLSGFIKRDQDVSMDTLIKLTYLATTNEKSSKGVFNFVPGYKFRNKGTTKVMIEALGKAISNSCKKSGSSKMFTMFVKSNPEVYTNYKGGNKNLILGILALKYYAFMCNDTNIRRLVNKIA